MAISWLVVGVEVVFRSVFIDDNNVEDEDDYYHGSRTSRARTRRFGDKTTPFIGEKTIARCYHATQPKVHHRDAVTCQASGPVRVEEKVGVGALASQKTSKRIQALFALSKTVFGNEEPALAQSFSNRWMSVFVPLVRLQTMVATAISINTMLDGLVESESSEHRQWQDSLLTEVNNEVARITNDLSRVEAKSTKSRARIFAKQDDKRLQLIEIVQHELQKQEYTVKDMFPDVISLLYRALNLLVTINRIAVPISLPMWADPCTLLRKTNNNWQIGLTNVGVSFYTGDSEFSEEACIRQVNLWQSLNHPNIIKLQAACHVGAPFFVYEHGRSLVEYLQSPEGAKCTWTRLYEAALGLQFLHSRDVVYSGALTSSDLFAVDVERRDPANPSVRVITKLKCDRVKSLTGPSSPEPKTNNLTASAEEWQWMAPELLDGGQSTRASDVFALGMCILHALTGTQSWEAELSRFRAEPTRFSNCLMSCVRDFSREESNVEAIKQQIRSGALPEKAALLPQKEADLIRQMCTLDPLDRADISLVVDHLRLLSEEEIDAEEVSPVDQLDAASISISAMKIRGHSVRSLLFAIRYLWTREGPKTPSTQSSNAIIGVVNRLDALITSSQAQRNGMWPARAADSLVSIITRLEQASQTSSAVNSGFAVSLSWTSVEESASFVADRKILDICRSIHLQIDNIVSVLGLDYASEHFVDSKDLDLGYDASSIQTLGDLFKGTASESLQEWIVQFCTSSQDNEKEELLILLQFELKNHSSSYTSAAISQMISVISSLEQKIGPTLLPKWFLPASEVEFDSFDAFAQGSFGSVHRGKWLNTDVVIKKVLGSGTECNDADDRRVFVREADIWSLLKHENVIQLYGACHLHNQRFFVCEYAPLGTLDAYILAQRRLRQDAPGTAANDVNVWQLLYGVGCGLAFLHENSVSHGDLKSNQVLIGGDKTPKLTDFGLSELSTRRTDDHTQDKPVGALGAYRWKAPEVLRGEVNTSFQADVFSFGMLIIEAVTGEVPWGRNLPDAVVKVHVKAGRLPTPTPHRAFGLKTALEIQEDDEVLGGEFTDAQWDLVEAMCRFDPADRMSLREANSAILRFSLASN